MIEPDHLDPRRGPRTITSTVIWGGIEFAVAAVIIIVLMLLR